MSKAKLFDREVKANKSPRNAFDIGYSTLFSSPCGQLLPCYVEDVKQGDRIKLGVYNVTRTRPANTSAFISFDEKVDFWFVPYELLWSAYPQWRMMQTFRTRSTDLSEVGKQNLLPFTSWKSLSLFADYLASKTVAPPYYYSSNVADFVRYLDLLGYGCPPISNIANTAKSTSVPPGDLVNSLKSYFSTMDSSGLQLNYFRLAAFQCVYMHGYRNLEYEKLDPTFYNCDNLFSNMLANNTMSLVSTAPNPTSSTPYFLVSEEAVVPSNPQASHITLEKLFKPRYKSWRDDVFTSIKPVSGFEQGTSGFEQNWDTTVPEVLNGGTLGSSFLWDLSQARPAPDSGNVGGIPAPSSFQPTGSSQPASTQLDFTYQFYRGSSSNNPALARQTLYTQLRGLSGGAPYGLSYLYPQNIRNLMSQDSFIRSAIYADKDYKSQMIALFGEVPDDYKCQRPTYLGTYSTNVTFSDVTATSAGSDGETDAATSVLGEIAGKGYNTGSDGNVFNHKFDHDGVVLGIHYIMPRNNYDNYRMSRFNTKLSRWDYFSPQFDGLGLQPVFAYERNLSAQTSGSGNPAATSVLGYAPRYFEYKQRTNEVHDTFMSNQPDYDWTLSNNATAITVGSDITNYKILPNITDRIFAVAFDGSAATCPFYHYYEFDVTRVSDMEIYGTPKV